MPSQQNVLAALSKVQEPELHKDLVSLNMVHAIRIDGGAVEFTIRLTTPACPLKHQIERECVLAVGAIPDVTGVKVRFDANTARDTRLANLPVRNIVAVGSGKGGVGKSTTAVNLAIALKQQGARVGLLDADIYGPNIPLMMGVKGSRPNVSGGKLVPVQAHGLQLMSMGFLLGVDQPAILRGPMLHKALEQFIRDVAWSDCDYLIVDLPPGTGDVQLSLSQIAPMTGAVVVTTPQDVALEDVRKSIYAFKSMSVPVLGVIENMSYFIAPDTGRRYDIFGHGGGQRMAGALGVPFLGEVPIDQAIREGGDHGLPIVAGEPGGAHALAYQAIASALAAKISVMNAQRAMPGFIALDMIPIG
ncbi:MAG: Mrp/NBP35 family ATP-binding protein [Thermoflexales bacterium]